MSKDLTPDPKRDINAIIKKIQQNTRHTPVYPVRQSSSDSPLMQGEQRPGILQNLKNGFKYVFANDKWLQDRRDKTARWLQISRERHDEAMQQKNQQFRTMELAISELQRQETQIFQAEERQRDRELQTYLAQAHDLMLQQEGEQNREMTRKLAALQRELQTREGQLNRENLLKMEMIRAEISKWAVERQREIQLELRHIDADLQRELRLEDRKTAIGTVKENKRLQNNPLCAQAEEILVGTPEQGIPPLIILLSPPTLKFDERGGGNPIGNSPLAQHFPLIEKKLAEAMHSLAELYARRNRPLRVIDGGWRSKAAHGHAAALQVFGEIKSEPGLLLESTVQSHEFFLNIGFWASGWQAPRYQAAVSLDWHEALYESVKTRILAWEAKQAGKSEQAIIKLYGQSAVDNFRHNLDIIAREQQCLEEDIDLTDIDRDYKISRSDSARLGRFLIATNLLHAALVIDEYFLLWVPFEQRQPPLSPLLPILLPAWFKDMEAESLAEFTALAVNFYQNLYAELGTQSPDDLPLLYLEYADTLAELPDKVWALRQLDNALGVLVSQRGENIDENTDLWAAMYTHLQETDVAWVALLNQVLEKIGDERDFDVAKACFERALQQAGSDDAAVLTRVVADFTQAIHVQADYRAAWLQRGLAYSALEQWVLAEQDFTQALTLADDAITRHQRAKTCFEQGKLVDAVADAEAATRQDAGLPDLAQDLRLFRATLAADEKRQREAMEAAELKRRKAEAAELKRRKVEAAERRKREDRTRAGNTFCDPLKSGGLAPEMMVIPAGSFQMGGTGHSDEKPIHPVNIAEPFAIGKYQVTFDNYDYYCQATGKNKPDDENWGRGKRPVINVSWQDAVNYCQWLSEQTGHEYRLPSEAEWEYACRAGSKQKYCFGDDEKILEDYAWYDANSGSKTHPVGEKKANAWELHDVHGNVWEWCQDHWHGNYKGAPDDGSAWESGGDNNRLLRGGCWDINTNSCRAAYRNNDVYGGNDRGFRVLCVVSART
ncbi:SUMF1/EgtB/PvdO family nonheme iron enzyme [Candidatus Venteria ishoeyi]|uniref:Serine/threonine-protein kinase pkn1 n=1 Tax=Candidatus Venteria ishoeyi TaxID=1899563 RepID=A0A1H6FC95_9GAMM|nr:SUMF1/EgtB/PvdO family nonheme iron enzyme [Candidatus Venteria ishoeyi]SEH06635.1 Serine/threonine-protein kinase pkn1 [Candidatus Venteria ishoeyi]